MYGSKETDYSIVDGTPYGKGHSQGLWPRLALAKASSWASITHRRRTGIIPDGFGNTWDFNEDEQDFADYIDNYVKPQVREILTNYGPIAIIWFDTPRIIAHHQSQELLELVHQLQPDCLVCGRLGNQLGDYATAQDNAIPPDLQAEDRLGDARDHQRHLGLQDA